MADEQNKDWQKEREEREAEEKAREAEHERKMKSFHRWDIALNCLWAATIALSTVMMFVAAFELGRRIGACAGKKPEKTCIVEPAAVETTGAPRIVPDDIFGAYAVSTGAEVTGIVGDRGLPTPPPVRYFRGAVGSGYRVARFLPR